METESLCVPFWILLSVLPSPSMSRLFWSTPERPGMSGCQMQAHSKDAACAFCNLLALTEARRVVVPRAMPVKLEGKPASDVDGPALPVIRR